MIDHPEYESGLWTSKSTWKKEQMNPSDFWGHPEHAYQKFPYNLLFQMMDFGKTTTEYMGSGIYTHTFKPYKEKRRKLRVVKKKVVDMPKTKEEEFGYPGFGTGVKK